jgi:hypothetical protein
MFPRHFATIVDEQNRLIDYRLFENDGDAYRARNSWRIADGTCSWRVKGGAKYGYPWGGMDGEISYDRSDLQISLRFIPFDTLHKWVGISDDELRLRYPGYDAPPKVMAAARAYEYRSLTDPGQTGLPFSEISVPSLWTNSDCCHNGIDPVPAK